MTPYYVSEDGSITVWHSRWEDVVAAGLVPVREVALVHADPPYGIALDTKPRGVGKRVPGLGSPRGSVTRRPHWPEVRGDQDPFDPAPLLALDRPLVAWGANHYASRLPDSPSWLLWDKREDVTPDDGADGELAWTSLGGPLRIFRHLWRGLCRASESGGTPGVAKHLHPTQKPIALCSWVYARAKLAPGSLVFVPYMGSGPDLAACKAAGLRCVACEVEEEYCRVAVGARLHAAPVPDHAGLPLFAGRMP